VGESDAHLLERADLYLGTGLSRSWRHRSIDMRAAIQNASARDSNPRRSESCGLGLAFVTRVVLPMVTSMAERSNQPRSNNKGDRPRLGDIRIELTLPREVYNRLLVLESMSGMSRTRVAASFIAQAVKDPDVAARFQRL
jgi:hypothetical protein